MQSIEYLKSNVPVLQRLHTDFMKTAIVEIEPSKFNKRHDCYFKIILDQLGIECAQNTAKTKLIEIASTHDKHM